jgi:hypothetical protein
LNLGHLDFDTPQRTPGRIVSTSDFNLPDNSLPNMMIQSTTNNHLSFISNHCALGIFTLVKSPLQIAPFMQNKANFPDAQMNINLYVTKDYENKSNWTLGKNKPNTKPIRTQSNPIKPNLKPIQTQNKPNQTQLVAA